MSKRHDPTNLCDWRIVFWGSGGMFWDWMTAVRRTNCKRCLAKRVRLDGLTGKDGG